MILLHVMLGMIQMKRLADNFYHSQFVDMNIFRHWLEPERENSAKEDIFYLYNNIFEELGLLSEYLEPYLHHVRALLLDFHQQELRVGMVLHRHREAWHECQTEHCMLMF